MIPSITLRKLIALDILSENIAIADDRPRHCGKDCDQGKSCTCITLHPLVNITRNFGAITEDIIIKHGGEPYLDWTVINVVAHRANKFGVLLHNPAVTTTKG